MFWSIAAILTGYLVMGLGVRIGTMIAAMLLLGDTSTGTDPTSDYLLTRLGISVFFAVVGGFATARIAGFSPMKHVLGLIILSLALQGAMLVAVSGDLGPQPGWYPATVALLGAGGMWFGGLISVRRMSIGEDPTDP